MVRRRNVLTLVSTLIVACVLFQFQNCAPASKLADANVSGEVGIVDDFDKAQIQFVSRDLEVQAAALETQVMGLCNRAHNGDRLRWSIWGNESSTSPLMTGESFCQGGQFSFKVEDLAQIECGVKHVIVVAGDWGGSTLAHLAQRCPARASQSLPTPEDAPYGTACELEFNSDPQPSCTQVCYRAGIVVSSQSEAASACASLSPDLAGR